MLQERAPGGPAVHRGARAGEDAAGACTPGAVCEEGLAPGCVASEPRLDCFSWTAGCWESACLAWWDSLSTCGQGRACQPWERDAQFESHLVGRAVHVNHRKGMLTCQKSVTLSSERQLSDLGACAPPCYCPVQHNFVYWHRQMMTRGSPPKVEPFLSPEV